MSRNIKMILEYEGTAYHGWQYQKNGISIQQTLSEAITSITGEIIMPIGAGRTDAGVHAKGQVATFITNSNIPSDKFANALNAKLPSNISVVSTEEVLPEFHPRKSAESKWYRYQIFQSVQRSALLVNRTWHISHPLHIERMKSAANMLIGTHNFHAFCTSGSSVKTYERTILSAQWSDIQGILCFDICGTGFLYNMVRILVGTMVEVGKGKRTLDSITELLNNGDRTKAGVTAPPEGLYLMKVYY